MVPTQNVTFAYVALGWVAQWDTDYQKWYYVNEYSSTKTPQWEHPNGIFDLSELTLTRD